MQNGNEEDPLQIRRQELDFLSSFWDIHGVVFMKWFLSLPSTGQVSILRNACPDLAASPVPEGELGLASDRLVPEMNIEGLLECQGRGFIRLMYQRAKKDCMVEDILYLKDLRRKQCMPTFSKDEFDPKKVAIAFVDPTDPSLQVQCVMHPVEKKEIVQEIVQRIEQDELIEADVWLTLQFRQQTLIAFIANVAHTFESMFLQDEISFSSPALGCRVCGTKDQLFKCPCDAVFYCSKDHQKEDWVYHKDSCKELRSKQ